MKIYKVKEITTYEVKAEDEEDALEKYVSFGAYKHTEYDISEVD